MGFLGVKIARALVFLAWELLLFNYFSSYFLEILVLQTGFEIIGYTPEFNTSIRKQVTQNMSHTLR